ncbi:molybdopterin-guanine dinucleotide biosynthesis protein A [gamma proteobacterium NOR5-3]|nr:molybdopterin-guanine dinucleotide biosynthesis protein A [gamma proteobacterium NOR5-3]
MANADYPTQSPPRETIARPESSQPRDSGTLGLVLCGGAGRRMGGRDKGLLDIAGRPAVTRPLELLAPICERCFISANRHQDVYTALGLGEVISDLRPGFQGPLAGMESIFPRLKSVSGTQILLLLPCDLPLLSADVPRQLLRELQARPELDIVYAATESQSHYLCAALRVEILGTLTGHLDRDQRAVHRWYAQCASAALLFDGDLAKGFANINEVEDLRLQSQVAPDGFAT